MKKIVVILLMLCTAVGTMRAQLSSFPQERMAELYSTQRYKDCLATADSVRQLLLSTLPEGKLDSAASRQLLLSTNYYCIAMSRYQDVICDSMNGYYLQIMPRLTKLDYTLAKLLCQGVDSLMCDTDYLKSVKVESCTPFLKLPKNCSFNYTPTLYAYVLCRSAMRAFGSKDSLYGVIAAHYRNMAPSAERNKLLLFYEYSNVNRYDTTAVQQLINRYRHYDDDQLADIYYKMADLYSGDREYQKAITYCDSAISRFPSSIGAVYCQRLRYKILWDYRVRNLGFSKNICSNAAMPVYVEVKNVDTVYFQVLKYSRSFSDNKKHQRVVRKWTMPYVNTKNRSKYEDDTVVATLPPLKPGKYELQISASPNFEDSSYSTFNFQACSMALQQTFEKGGILVDYTSGKPIAHKKVVIHDMDDESYIKRKYATTTTNEQGVFAFDIDFDDDMFIDIEPVFSVNDHGAWIDMEVSGLGYSSSDDDAEAIRIEIQQDRPIYRPGDTVHLSLLAMTTEGSSTKHVLADANVKFKMIDRSTVLDSTEVVTDEWGRAFYQYVIQSEGVGTMGVQAIVTKGNLNGEKDDTPIFIESYKQPRFDVVLQSAPTLNDKGHAIVPKYGDSLILVGKAVSTSQAPVSKAMVKYSVKRRTYDFAKACDCENKWGKRGAIVIITDTLTTDAEGNFRIAFQALPDSTSALDCLPSCYYDVEVTVTDAGGESHTESKNLELVACKV